MTSNPLTPYKSLLADVNQYAMSPDPVALTHSPTPHSIASAALPLNHSAPQVRAR